MVLLSSLSFAFGQRNITEEEWDDFYIDGPVVLEFYADWCAPCRTQQRILEQMVREFPDIKFFRVNIDNERDWFESVTETGAIPLIRFYSVKEPRNYDLYRATIEALMPEYEFRDSCRAILSRYKQFRKRYEKPLRMQTAVTDTIIDLNGKQYHLALSGAVDLGINIKWAAFNIDAHAPQESGGYYAWGETNTKSSYTRDSYRFYNPSERPDIVTKYSDYIDRNYLLQAADDVATVKWGERWRMPTDREMRDLLWGLEWTQFNLRGVDGLVAHNDSTRQAIFFPCAGAMQGGELVEYGWALSLWTLNKVNGSSSQAYSLEFNAKNDTFLVDYHWDRTLGYPIRAVYDRDIW